jgi:hypothetical protein
VSILLIVPCWLLAIQMYEKSGSPGSPHLGPRSGGNTTPVLVPGSVPAVVPTSLSVPDALTAPVVSTAVVAVTSPVDVDEDEDEDEPVEPVTLSPTEPALDSASEALPVGFSCVVDPLLPAVVVAVTVAAVDAESVSTPVPVGATRRHETRHQCHHTHRCPLHDQTPYADWQRSGTPPSDAR